MRLDKMRRERKIGINLEEAIDSSGDGSVSNLSQPMSQLCEE
jgi:hypothetical protein